MSNPKPTAPPAISLDRAWELLTHSLNKQKNAAEIQQRITAHLRAVLGKPTLLPNYRNDKSVPEADKIETYKMIIRCVASSNYGEMQGQVGQGDKRIESSPAPTRTTIPALEPVAALAPRSESGGGAMVVEPPVVPGDDLTRLLVDKLKPYLPTGKSVDENAVRNIVADQMIQHYAAREHHLDSKITTSIRHAMGNGEFPVDRVKGIVDEALRGLIMRVAITAPDGKLTEIDRQHYKFPLLMAALSQRLNVLLVGPAGSSKTTAAHAASKALTLPFEAISVGPMTSKADLFGFVDANGKYHDTATVRRAVDGGVMLWDEVDAANAGVLTAGNMLLANEHVATPVGMKGKHKDFVLIAAANTYGMGANRVYVGRNQLDGATLDRFVVIDWDYDEGLEGHIIGVVSPSPLLDVKEGGAMKPKAWLDYVLQVRKACEKLAIRHIVSPRASIHGVKLFAAGVGRKCVEDMVLWKGMDTATRAKITAEVRNA